MPPRELFLSHSSEDRTFTAELAAAMRSHGIPVWYSATNILGAQQWHDEIGLALRRCDWFLVVLSPRSVTSLWVKRELTYALQQRRFENRIVPLLLEECDYEGLSWVLPSFQMVDFRKPTAEAYGDLLRLWGIGYRGG